jgi:hypothetical protein
MLAITVSLSSIWRLHFTYNNIYGKCFISARLIFSYTKFVNHRQDVWWVCFLNISTSLIRTVRLLCMQKLPFSMWLCFRYVLWLSQSKYHKMNNVWLLRESFMHVLSQKFTVKVREPLLCILKSSVQHNLLLIL